ncbi:GNAT family N-acetyltransferase [Chryseobacterium oncorhynchi]|uniref:GNAT family N-acetyltransferase n=1 Tax=Chryseobacterium oncorhynchi TaxID=741074 RepID=A0A316WJR7_9FLAO|nr:GNAT family N-acetyltransferase [Chryseobacterium oncorhynchi]PWN60683.1 GNAT family N-acetyltransferase [Chryseobacterium oncorhynchi]
MNSNTSNNSKISIRNGNKNDLNEMLLLFRETISSICKNDYTHDQLEVWKSGAENKERWEKVIGGQFILVAVYNHQIVGFCTLEKGDYIDLLFVHKDYQHQGIASQLYHLIEKEAVRQNKKHLTADVSKTAKSFFERVGFEVIREQTVNVKGIDLTNYKMEKKLIL